MNDQQRQPWDDSRTIAEIEAVAASWYRVLDREQVLLLRGQILTLLRRAISDEGRLCEERVMALEAANEQLAKERDEWRERAEGAIYALMEANPDMLAGNMREWIKNCATSIELLREVNPIMERNIKAQGARIVELQAQLNKAQVSIPNDVCETLGEGLSELHNQLYSSHSYAKEHPEEVEALRKASEWLGDLKDSTAVPDAGEVVEAIDKLVNGSVDWEWIGFGRFLPDVEIVRAWLDSKRRRVSQEGGD